MEEETTPDIPVESGGQTIQGVQIDDQGQAVSVPDDTTGDEPAVQDHEEPEEAPNADVPEESGGEEPAPDTEDKKLQKFAKSQGLELDSPNAIKAAQIAMKAQSEATRNYQKTAELEKAANITNEQIDPSATPEQRDNIRVRNLELKSDIREWKYQNQDKLALEPQMVEILADPSKKLLVQEGYLSLDDVYAMARGSASDNTASIKSQGGQEALQKLAQKQQAQAPRGNATNSAQMSGASKITPQNVDQVVAGMSAEEYRRRLPEINRAMAG